MAVLPKRFPQGLALDPQSADPSNPTEGQLQFADGTARGKGVWQYKDSVWQQIGGGQGSVNYIEDPDLEGGVTFFTGNESDAAKFVASAETSSPLEGVQSLLLTKVSGADQSGEYIDTDDFTIAETDQSSVMEIGFAYSTVAAYADDDFEIKIYDVENSVEIEPVGKDLKAGENQHHFCTFQTAAFGGGGDEGKYRLRFKVVDTSSTELTVRCDRFKLSPIEKFPSAAAISDWKAFTPTLTGGNTFTLHTAMYRRVGDSLEVEFSCEITNTGTTAAVSWNSLTDLGLAIDTNKLLNASNADSADGHHSGTGTIFDTSATEDISVTIKTFAAGTGNTNRLYFYENSGSGSGFQIVNGNNFTTGDGLSFKASVPILGWSAGSQDVAIVDDNRIIAFEARGLDQTVADSANTTLLFGVDALTQTHTAYDAVTGIFTVPVSGYYNMNVAITGNTGTAVAGDRLILDMFKDGVAIAQDALEHEGTNASSTWGLNTSVTAYLIKDEEIKCQLDNDSSEAQSFNSQNYSFSGHRVSGHNQIVADEIVSCLLADNSGQLIDASGSNDTPTWNTVEKDTHGSFSSDTYTFNTPGHYSISVGLRTATVSTVSEGDTFTIFLSKNADTDYREIGREEVTDAASNHVFTAKGSALDYFESGDTLSVNTVLSTTGSTVGLSNASGGRNYFQIVKIGR